MRFRVALEMINVTVDSRGFGTMDNPIETEDLFVRKPNRCKIM